MKQYAITKNFLTGKVPGWGSRENSDMVEIFTVRTEQEALEYLKKNYGPLIELSVINFYVENKKKLNTYDLHILLPKNKEKIRYVTTALSKEKEKDNDN